MSRIWDVIQMLYQIENAGFKDTDSRILIIN